jgi:hypothetical protein
MYELTHTKDMADLAVLFHALAHRVPDMSSPYSDDGCLLSDFSYRKAPFVPSFFGGNKHLVPNGFTYGHQYSRVVQCMHVDCLFGPYLTMFHFTQDLFAEQKDTVLLLVDISGFTKVDFCAIYRKKRTVS